MISANQLTILRMVFVPIFVFLVLDGHLKGALAVFLLAGVTDLLDGLIARKFGQKTPIGGTFNMTNTDAPLMFSAFSFGYIVADASGSPKADVEALREVVEPALSFCSSGLTRH